MKNKLYITALSDNAKTILSKQAHCSGMHYAKYVLVSIDETTNQTKAQAYVGDIITVLKNIFLNTGLKALDLGNFRLAVKVAQNTETKPLSTVSANMVASAIDAEVHGDGINALIRLVSSTHIAIAKVVGKRGSSEVDYGTILYPVGISNDDTPIMIDWKKIKASLEKEQISIHNISYDKQKRQLIRTNISTLDTVYLVVNVTPKATKAQPVKKNKQAAEKEAEQKEKLLNNLTAAKSTLAYSLTPDYSLETMQYILKIHTQNEPIDYLMNPKYDVGQLRALHRAYKLGIDITLIADPLISEKTMHSVIDKFQYGLWNVIDVENLRKTSTDLD